MNATGGVSISGRTRREAARPRPSSSREPSRPPTSGATAPENGFSAEQDTHWQKISVCIGIGADEPFTFGFKRKPRMLEEQAC